MKKHRNPEQMSKIAQHLHQKGRSLRQIARTLGVHRSTVKKWLSLSPQEHNSPPHPAPKPSKLDPFQELIEELCAKQGLTQRKILQRLRQEGYTGGKTILSDRIRAVRGALRTPKAFARYEPAPALEAQMDWSPYTVKINTRPTKIHLFSMILSYSRYQYMEVFQDERQDTLFAGHVEAFEMFHGVPARILYDNQTPVVPTRLPSGLPLLHPRFEAFAEHYGFRPQICLPGDKERKGRVERPFHYFETNFLPLRQFGSLKDLRDQLRAWLDGDEGEPSGNFRIHGTTRQRPVDMWQDQEAELLIPLPPAHFLPTRVEQRLVAKDCLISVFGNSFTVPPAYVGRQVTVLTSPKIIKVFNPAGEVIAAHHIPAGKGNMVIDPAHYAQIKRCQRYIPADQLSTFFSETFPDRGAFLDGLKRHLNSIAPIHLQHLRNLLDHFTCRQLDQAIETAEGHGVFTVTYVENILKRRFPGQVGLRHFDPQEQKPKGFRLGAVDPGDPQAYGDIFQEDEDRDDPAQDHNTHG